jgi:PAS domain S-box-containing protein
MLMSRPLRVLVLEDHQDDARLILDELRRAGFDPSGERVETETEFLARLDPAPELILADYHLRRFDALRALRLVQERGLDVPFIFVTGVLGDEAVVECLKQGAADYLRKDRVARLGPAVAHALDQRQARVDRLREMEAVREREEKLLLLLHSTGEAIYSVDLDGCCTFCNAACLRLLGYAQSRDLLGKNMHWMVHHTRADGTPYPLEECRIFQAFRQGEGAHVEDEVMWRADGISFPVE